MPMAKDVLFVPGRIPAIPSRTVARAARRFRNAPRPCPPTSPTSATSRLTKRRLANLSSILMIHSSSERVGITCMRISLEGYMSRVPPMNCVGGGVSAPPVTPCLMQWIVDCIKSLSLRT